MRKKLKSSKPALSPMRRIVSHLVFRRILVPLDFSGQSRQALSCAVPLARKYGARISLVHVVQPPVIIQSTPGGGIAVPVDTTKLIIGARIHLEQLAQLLLPDSLRGEIMVCEGNPAHEVVTAAAQLRADLIVLSTIGRSGLKRVLLGSTAERILRHAHCPVLTVRRQPDESAQRLLAVEKPLYSDRLPWRSMLVPLDFSQLSTRALRAAVILARQSGARLLLLNVIEPNPYPSGMDGAVLVMPDFKVAQKSKRELVKLAQRLVPRSRRVTTLVARGRPSDVIVATAEERRADLIVLSTHGHTGLDRLLMGSVAELVIRHARCPVLVLR